MGLKLVGPNVFLGIGIPGGTFWAFSGVPHFLGRVFTNGFTPFKFFPKVVKPIFREPTLGNKIFPQGRKRNLGWGWFQHFPMVWKMDIMGLHRG